VGAPKRDDGHRLFTAYGSVQQGSNLGVNLPPPHVSVLRHRHFGVPERTFAETLTIGRNRPALLGACQIHIKFIRFADVSTTWREDSDVVSRPSSSAAAPTLGLCPQSASWAPMAVGWSVRPSVARAVTGSDRAARSSATSRARAGAAIQLGVSAMRRGGIRAASTSRLLCPRRAGRGALGARRCIAVLLD
jgi:hypothetical protein